MKYSSIDAIVLDMDGVLWRGGDPLDGMTEMFDWLRETETPFALATNNSSRTQADYVAKLTKLGVDWVTEEHIVTSATATAAYLQQDYPAGTPVHVFGMDGLRHILTEAGFDTSDEIDGRPEVVVAGIDFEMSYEKLKQAALYIRAGAVFIGTNPDKTFPAPEGLVPGAGSMIAALETATDQTATIIGKPAQPMFDAALQVTDTLPERTLMVGDRLNTDIEGAQAIGMQTALVFTGVTTSRDLSNPDNTTWPDVAYEGLPELLKAWAGFDWYNARIKAKRKRTQR